MELSRSANADGLSYKIAELANCVRVLRDSTGAARVKLVAHSAGGLVCRTWMQSAKPDSQCEVGSVDRLITIAAPHLGAAIATKLGDLLGTRATSLMPDAPLIQRLNTELDLPRDANYKSQNLRLAACSRRFEEQTGRPVDGILVRVPDPSHDDGRRTDWNSRPYSCHRFFCQVGER